MARILDSSWEEFDEEFVDLLDSRSESHSRVDSLVSDIIERVVRGGDKALVELTESLDRVRLTPETLAFSREEIDRIISDVPKDQERALELAADRVLEYHQKQVPENAEWTDASGVTLGWRWTPVDSAGLYVPGGRAAYPSSVLMNAMPAKAAGVREMAMTVPTPDGEVNPLVLLAARLAGIETVYRVGGAQAIAALAFGTESVRMVQKITGPGNAYVASAKRQVFGRVGIDMVAGPSEVLIIADGSCEAGWLAIDLLSQAEHDEDAQAILICVGEDFAQEVADSVDRRLKELPRSGIAGKSWRQHGAVIAAKSLDEAARLSNRVAPEHLQLCVEDPEPLLSRITHAGAVFIGQWTPEAIGDYVAGPSHVLPTGRTSRFSSGLSVLDYMKRTSVTRMTPEAMAALGPAAETLARAEGLQAHALSIRDRLESLKGKSHG